MFFSDSTSEKLNATIYDTPEILFWRYSRDNSSQKCHNPRSYLPRNASLLIILIVKYEELLKKAAQQQRGFQGPTIKIPKTGCGWILGCIGSVFILVGLFIFGMFYVTSVWVEQTTFVPGEAESFDPISSYREVHAYAGDETKLFEMEASYVKSDGTLNLTEEYIPSPNVEYSFYRELSEPPKDAPPLGAGQNASNTWYEKVTVSIAKPWQLRRVMSYGGGVSADYQYINLGMDRDTGSPTSNLPGQAIDPPACHLNDLWEAAIQEGAPEAAVAVITYDEEGYELSIRDMMFEIHFDQDCRLIREE